MFNENMLHKLRKQYEDERKSIPDFMLENHVYNHLTSFENYVIWYSRMNDLFEDKSDFQKLA